MKDDMAQIADRVRGVIAEKRLDQEAVASILGISRQSVSQRLRGKVAFTAPELFRLAVALSLPVWRFYPEVPALGRVA